jgi:hypothetical protein
MGLHDPFEYFKHKLWQKKGQEWKCQFWLSPTKSQESTWNKCVEGRATYNWKALNKHCNITLDFTSIGGLNNKLRPFKLLKVPISKILGFPTWESQDKMTFGCNLRG